MNIQRLIHYSYKPILQVIDKEQDPDTSFYCKPRGLWVSVEGGDDWKTWCEAESFRNVSSQLAYEIKLVQGANILRLCGALDIDCFTDSYINIDNRYGGIRWRDVAKSYQGIIIAPYVWSRRLDDKSGWYYVWDCASGCIWDATAVQCVTPITQDVSDSCEVKA